jgi:hypothetical protein
MPLAPPVTTATRPFSSMAHQPTRRLDRMARVLPCPSPSRASPTST